MEQSSSLNNPTSSQFFKKRVGVGVWSESQEEAFKFLDLKSTVVNNACQTERTVA